ncbi:hypothetical protein DSCOOX_60440 [Desulfosarcina ovata subsp. ovata]|uniref:Outer membrane beta-barrel protein n=1 Tax=Desulfosarcina ovata subsp. ovata TaxID=2752305 RepID=A0A5K8AMM4_9BACT|nr:hypothetical protein DSCOOX_60440 [Desulfosarcina ovata subsp. ovata]
MIKPLNQNGGLALTFFFVIIALLATLATWFCFSPHALAADYKLLTSVATSYAYNDNILLTDENVLSDSIYTVAPKLEWARNGERLSAKVDGTAEWYRYQDNDEYDDTDQWYNAILSYRPTERWQLEIQGHASDDNRPDRDIETTGMVLKNTRRKRFNTSATASYIFSEVTSGGIFAALNREDFDDPETSDRRDYSIFLFMNRSLEAWIARTTGHMNAGFSHYNFDREYDFTKSAGSYDFTYMLDDEYTVDNYSFTLGTESALSEKLNFSIDLGGRYSQSESESTSRQRISLYSMETDPLKESESYSSWGAVGTLEISYQGERSNASLLVSHDLTPVSGENGTANRTTVRIGGSMKLLENLRGNVAFQWYQNKSDKEDSTQNDIDTQTWNFQTGIRWELNRKVAISGKYFYTIYDKREAGTTAERNKFLIQVVAEHDWLE